MQFRTRKPRWQSNRIRIKGNGWCLHCTESQVSLGR